MKRIAAIALLAAAGLVASAGALAQSAALEVNIPFDFTVDNVTLPAGSYTVGSDVTHPAMLVIRDKSNAVKATYMGMNDTGNSASAHTLVFHQYGEQYFLSVIRFGSASKTIVLPVTRSEKQARRHSRKENIASVATS